MSLKKSSIVPHKPVCNCHNHGWCYDPHECQQILLPGKLPVEHSRNGLRHHGKNSQGLYSLRWTPAPAVVLTTLLFGSECWTLYRKHIKQLKQFHMRCLRKIAGIRWQDRVSNTRVLEMCGISCIEAFLLLSQFHWVGHAVRMLHFRIPKQAFFGQLQGGPVRHYKDSLKINLRACDLAPSVLRTAPLDRSVWRQCCSNAISAFEERHTAALVAKRKARKDPVAARGTMMWTCDVCGRPCASHIGLFAHRKSHR